VFARRSILAFIMLLLLTACAAVADPTTPSTTIIIPVTTTAVSTTAVSTVPPPETCEPPTFLPTLLPDRVIDDRPDVSAVPLDEFTLQPGTIVTGWTDGEGNPVLAMVRGALPPTRWVNTPERITVRGIEAALGDLGDGIWGVAWFEGPERCDEYFLVFYPPAGPEEARVVAESLTGSG
jgi:hypothetical protein